MSVDSELSTAAVRRYYRLVDVGDVDSVVTLFTEDAVYRRPGYAPIVGRGNVRSFYSGTRMIERGEHSLSSVIVNGGQIAVKGNFDGRLKDGRDVHVEFADFFTVTQDGQFSSRETFFFAPLV